MNTDTDVLHVPELARKLGRTEASIRSSVNRGGEDLPPRLMIGRRLAWRAVTVEQWLAAREQKPARKAGRKAKAEV